MTPPPAAAAPVARVRAGDVELAYRRWGQGPPVVLVHGGPGGSGSYWPHALRGLVRERTLVAVDLRGHGASERRPPYSLSRFAADLSALPDALGLERPALLGHSFGALVALRAALDDPRFERVILVGGFARSWRTLAHPSGLSTKLRLGARLARWNVLQRLGRAPPLVPHLRALLREAEPVFTGPGTPAWVDDLLFASVVEPLDAVSPLQLDLLRWDVWREIPRLRARVLVAVGEHDLVGGAEARAMARRIPGARLAIIPGAGHSPFLERPEDFDAEVLRFLRAP